MNRFSRFDAPWTVQVHAYREPGKRLVLHFVNYDRDEGAKGTSVSAREAPVAAKPVMVTLRLPDGVRAKSVRFVSPDDMQEHTPEFRQKDGVLEFRTPGFLVYGLCVIEEEPAK